MPYPTLGTQLDDIVKTFNKVMVAYGKTVVPMLEAMRQIDTTLKSSSPVIAPIDLLGGRLEPVLIVPEELLPQEEEEGPAASDKPITEDAV